MSVCLFASFISPHAYLKNHTFKFH